MVDGVPSLPMGTEAELQLQPFVSMRVIVLASIQKKRVRNHGSLPRSLILESVVPEFLLEARDARATKFAQG